MAAVDETTAADAIEAIRLDMEPLPFAVDPLDSLVPGGPNARLDGNTMVNRELTTVKWNDVDWAAIDRGEMPTNGEVAEEWEVGDVAAGFAEADLVLDETVFHQSMGHQPLESLHGDGVLAERQVLPAYVDPEHAAHARCGGARYRHRAGGSCAGRRVLRRRLRQQDHGSIQMKIPALLSQKAGKPVMMRITRLEEHFIGRARPGLQGRVKIGFRRDGRITALDMFVVQDGGPYGLSNDYVVWPDQASLMYQPLSHRFRGLSVFTNTPPRSRSARPAVCRPCRCSPR